MKRITCIFLVLCLCLNLAGCESGAGDAGENVKEPEQVSQEELEDQALRMAGEYMKKMTLEEKIGQMFLVDVDRLVKGKGTVTDISPELLETIEKYKIGGIVLGRRNIQNADQVRTLIREVRQSVETSKDMEIPLYIGTEEEGGGENSIAAVTDTITSTGYVNPSEMGKNMTESQLENTGGVIADELIGLGFNLNLAPSADVVETEKPASLQAVSSSAVSVLGEEPTAPNTSGRKMSKAKKKKAQKTYQKSLQEYHAKWDAFMETYTEDHYNESCFGEDEKEVKKAVTAMVTGMHEVGEHGICTVLKIFPGISSVAKYHKLVKMKIDTGLSRLRRTNFLPFSAGISAGTDFVMVGHVVLSKVDQDAPASLSQTIMTDLLRNEMRFDGIILTERMDVPVITNHYTTEQAVTRAIVSGADMIYDPENLEDAIFSVQQAVMFKKIDEETIDQAVLRILKNKILRGVWIPPETADADK